LDGGHGKKNMHTTVVAIKSIKKEETT